MSSTKVLGPTAGAAATLPLTGTNIVLMVAASVAVIAIGLLLLRLTARRNQS